MNTAAATETRWFEMLDDTQTVAHYITDDVSEVYALAADAPYFIRVREDDGSFYLTMLTNDRAELIGGQARLDMVPDSVVAATIAGMLA